MTAALFTPIEIGGMPFSNRIAVAPMCQYSAVDGSATDWHMQHWTMLGLSGAGMVTVEMTDVERRGRISHGCHGLYSDENEAAAVRALAVARRFAAPGTRFGVQLAHAGRKASARRPWEGGGPLQPGEDQWPTVGPSPIPFAEGWPIPHELTEAEIDEILQKFAAAAQRAMRAGFDFIELHGAHGYLLQSFLSPLSNRRNDRFGGSLANRMRFILEAAKAVREAVPSLMLGARISSTDWVDGGSTPDEAVELAGALKEAGVSYICCSSGGNSPHARVPTTPGYQVHFAEKIKREAGIVTRAVGLIDDPLQAEAIVHDGRADLVALARAILADPRWPWRAAAMLGEAFEPVPQYARSKPTMLKWAAPAERRSAA